MDNDKLQEQIIEMSNTIENLSTIISRMEGKVDTMYEVFNNGKFLTRVAKWGFGGVMFLGGMYLMFKQIFFHY